MLNLDDISGNDYQSAFVNDGGVYLYRGSQLEGNPFSHKMKHGCDVWHLCDEHGVHRLEEHVKMVAGSTTWQCLRGSTCVTGPPDKDEDSQYDESVRVVITVTSDTESSQVSG